MVRIILGTLLLFQFSFSHSQNLVPERTTVWNQAGLTVDIQAPENYVSITDFGADTAGINNSNAAYTAAISSLNGHAGTIYFPAGDYVFSSTLTVPDSVFLKGDVKETVLRFDLGGFGNLIQLVGSISPTVINLFSDGIKGTNQLQLSDASSLVVGDIIRLSMFDEDLMFSSWAYGTLGQIVEIIEINGNTLILSDPLNHNYPVSRNASIKKLDPIRAAGIECLTIKREDHSETQHSNIYMNCAFNCVIRNVESERCDFTHAEINNSSHILLERNYFHHGIGYGGGGRAYGISFQVASSFCLAQNNVFEHLRHSMLIQAGANGNVFGYNYSTDPYWESSSLPANSAGDAVLHGNYTFMNLFEGNTIQNIVVDASHGNNGPFNTFFRNRAELYGFFSDSGTPTDSMNVIGNEITETGFPLGLFMVNGAGSYIHGNNIYGTPTPSGTNNIELNSLYINETEMPAFLNSQTLPMIGYPISISEKTLPAEERFTNGTPVSCASEVSTFIADNSNKETLVSLCGNLLKISNSLLPANISIYSANGKLANQFRTNSNYFELPEIKFSGMYLIRIENKNGKMVTLKAISMK